MHGEAFGRWDGRHGLFGGVTATTVAAGTTTVTGGSGVDIATLDSAGATLQVSGMEVLIGGPGADVVTVTGGTVRFVASQGGDQVTLAAGNGSDQVVFSGPNCPPYGGGTADMTISNFQTGTDSLVLTGGLRRAVDHDGDGVVDSATRSTGTISLTTDEVAVLSTTVSSLHDTDFAAVRTAIGSLTNSSANASVVVLANDGTSTGVYLVTDRNGDGSVAANEISLLGIVKGTTALGSSDILFG